MKNDALRDLHFARRRRLGDSACPARSARLLPPELLTQVLEFLPFAEMHTELKRVARHVRSAARQVLTKGRWRPVKFFDEQGLDVLGRHGPRRKPVVGAAVALVGPWTSSVSSAEYNGRRGVVVETPGDIVDQNRVLVAVGDQTLSVKLGNVLAVSAAHRADLKMAWEAAPAYCLQMCFSLRSEVAVLFLEIAEPLIGGLGRIVKHCEAAHRIRYALRKLENAVPDADAIDYHPCSCLARHVIVAWVDKFEGWDNMFQHNFALERFGWGITEAMQHRLAEALEYWESPTLAADFMYPDWAPDWADEDDVSFIGPNGGDSTAYALSVSWYDRRKALALVACATREDEARSRLDEEAAEYDPRVDEPNLPSIEEREEKFKVAVTEVEQELRLEPAPVSDREIGDCYAYMERVVKLGQCVGDSYDA